ncbi:unnamed protein product [Mycena citricolor]|uniref:Uncharacterized protein n=1 Tax=Mycena citricolor TaxID=2018698 RepID=A0AAD2H4S2_9AGAR|nr:unnamed protein product [Mycena citricolor]
MTSKALGKRGLRFCWVRCPWALLLVALIAALDVLYRHSPFKAQSSAKLVVWTYLPVAVLMVIEFMWIAYDLQVKILVPWAELSRGFTPAHRGWSLDYLGANMLANLWHAAKYRHATVLLTTLGLWSTAVAGVVTASLFRVQTIAYTAPSTLNRTTALMPPTVFDPGALADKGYTTSYLGRQVLGLPRPRWSIAGDIALEAVAGSPSSSGTLGATTRGYSADLVCSPATVVFAGSSIIPSAYNNALGSPTTVYSAAIAGAQCEAVYDLNHVNTGLLMTDSYLVGRVFNHTCPGSSRPQTPQPSSRS